MIWDSEPEWVSLKQITLQVVSGIHDTSKCWTLPGKATLFNAPLTLHYSSLSAEVVFPGCFWNPSYLGIKVMCGWNYNALSYPLMFLCTLACNTLTDIAINSFTKHLEIFSVLLQLAHGKNWADTPDCTWASSYTQWVNLLHHVTSCDVRCNGLICLSPSLQPHPRELWFSITTEDHASNFTVKLELNE